MKYFFLLDGWNVGRVWEFGGLWNRSVWKRLPNIHRTNVQIIENGETLWMYWVEDAVLMVEVLPDPNFAHSQDGSNMANNIGQVVLKRLITAEQAIERLTKAQQLQLNESISAG